MIDVYIGIGIFVFVYLCYLLLIVSNKKKLKKYIDKSKEVTMVKRKYKLDLDKINHKMIANLFGFTNGLILGGVYIIMSLISNIVLKFVAILLIFMVLTLIAYNLIGKYLKGKEVK